MSNNELNFLRKIPKYLLRNYVTAGPGESVTVTMYSPHVTPKSGSPPSSGVCRSCLEHNRAMPETTRGRDSRQEGRERSYYHLHRQLNNPLLLHNLKIEV